MYRKETIKDYVPRSVQKTLNGEKYHISIIIVYVMDWVPYIYTVITCGRAVAPILRDRLRGSSLLYIVIQHNIMYPVLVVYAHVPNLVHTNLGHYTYILFLTLSRNRQTNRQTDRLNTV